MKIDFLRVILSTPVFGFVSGVSYIITRTSNKKVIPKDYPDKDLLKLFYIFVDIVVTFMCVLPFIFFIIGFEKSGFISLVIAYTLGFSIGVITLIKARKAQDKNLKFLINGVVGSLTFVMSWIPITLILALIYAWYKGYPLF